MVRPVGTSFLIDTHVFLWSIREPERLSRKITKLLTADASHAVLSTASLWEIALKVRAGKLSMPDEPGFFVRHAESLGLEMLPIHVRHVNRVFELPDHHRDPFDRLLIAQAIVEDLPIVTIDPAFGAYGVKVIW
jgi:PIN domain nuclease of toxin-antitoxin system